MESLMFSLLAVLAISFLSLSGIFLLFLNKKISQKINLLLVSFAVGALLGDAFIHLLPESFESLDSLTVSLLTIGGLLIFFILEKILRWHHCHEINHSDHQSKHLVVLNIFGDTVHNLIDGMLIAASFIVDFKLGVITSIAVLLHEIPQEIGDFAILLHSGLSLKKTVFFNFVSASSAFLGVILVFILGSKISSLSSFLLPITAGGFIYLAASDLIPELHRHDQKLSNSFFQLTFIILGVALMSLLIFLE
ncbi:MAG: ZIP family metal transporter [Candidatus Shapirobacteria bacterium]|nr:ZIP family metal transporter [Candidatus Shapirobacteria bacterium]